MPASAKIITRADVLDAAAFAAVRDEARARIMALKAKRRVAVGPFVTFYFENYDTMWWQVHEMLRVEKGGPAQIADELTAYNPLIPQGAELVATLMIEIENPQHRARELARLGGIEKQIVLQVGHFKIPAEPEFDPDRTTAAGKTSAVHFVRFKFPPAAIGAFRDPAILATLAIAHPHYGHSAALPPDVRAALAQDFD